MQNFKAIGLSAVLSISAAFAQAQAQNSPCISSTTISVPPATRILPTASTCISPGQIQITAGPYTTIYQTTYLTFCSTGLQPKTYTVTESCSAGQPSSRPSGYIPSGFTTTVTECHSCGGSSPITATLTIPCGSCTGPGGVYATTPASHNNSPGSPSSPPTSNSGSGNSGTSGGGTGSGSGCSGSGCQSGSGNTGSGGNTSSPPSNSGSGNSGTSGEGTGSGSGCSGSGCPQSGSGNTVSGGNTSSPPSNSGSGNPSPSGGSTGSGSGCSGSGCPQSGSGNTGSGGNTSGGNKGGSNSSVTLQPPRQSQASTQGSSTQVPCIGPMCKNGKAGQNSSTIYTGVASASGQSFGGIFTLLFTIFVVSSSYVFFYNNGL